MQIKTTGIILLRTCVDRLAGDGSLTIATEMKSVTAKGTHRIEFRTKSRAMAEANLEIKYSRIDILPPIGKKSRYPALSLTVIHANERGKPEGRDAVNWKLLTDLPVESLQDAIEKLEWYAQRWKIEMFHKVLKSGCKAEEVKLRAAERLVNLIAVFCIVSWRILWMTMLNRTSPSAPPTVALTKEECTILDELVKDKPGAEQTLSAYITKIAQVGGYLARRSDSPPGHTVIWRGLSRLADIQLGVHIAARLVGT